LDLRELVDALFRHFADVVPLPAANPSRASPPARPS
jgi:hypothetical protein